MRQLAYTLTMTARKTRKMLLRFMVETLKLSGSIYEIAYCRVIEYHFGEGMRREARRLWEFETFIAPLVRNLHHMFPFALYSGLWLLPDYR